MEQPRKVYDYLNNPEERPFNEIREGIGDSLMRRYSALAREHFSLPEECQGSEEIDNLLRNRAMSQTDAMVVENFLADNSDPDGIIAYEQTRKDRINGESVESPTKLDFYLESLKKFVSVFNNKGISPDDHNGLIDFARSLYDLELEQIESISYEGLQMMLSRAESYYAEYPGVTCDEAHFILSMLALNKGLLNKGLLRWVYR